MSVVDNPMVTRTGVETDPFEPVEPPSVTNTRFLILGDEEDDFDELGRLGSYEQVAAASWGMTHGEIRSMRNWTMVQGGTPPWRLKRLFGVIPLPWVAFSSIIILLVASIQGLSLRAAVLLFLFTILALVGAGFWLSEYHFNQSGICLIGGEPVEQKWRKGVSTYNAKGKKIKISDSGYCAKHAWTVHRATLWSTVEAQVWRGIVSNPIRKPTALRKIGYAFFWWMGYHEDFIDPRPVGQGILYRRKDRTRPRDQLNENVVENVQKMLLMAATNLEKLKQTRRRE